METHLRHVGKKKGGNKNPRPDLDPLTPLGTPCHKPPQPLIRLDATDINLSSVLLGRFSFALPSWPRTVFGSPSRPLTTTPPPSLSSHVPPRSVRVLSVSNDAEALNHRRQRRRLLQRLRRKWSSPPGRCSGCRTDPPDRRPRPVHSTFMGATSPVKCRTVTRNDARPVNPTCTGPHPTVDVLPCVPPLAPIFSDSPPLCSGRHRGSTDTKLVSDATPRLRTNVVTLTDPRCAHEVFESSTRPHTVIQHIVNGIASL